MIFLYLGFVFMFKNLCSSFSYFKLHWKCLSLQFFYLDVFLFIFSIVLFSFLPTFKFLCLIFISFTFFDSVVNLSRYHFFRDLSIFINKNGVDSLSEYIRRNH